jgi:hypothetical protein
MLKRAFKNPRNSRDVIVRSLAPVGVVGRVRAWVRRGLYARLEGHRPKTSALRSIDSEGVRRPMYFVRGERSTSRRPPFARNGRIARILDTPGLRRGTAS